MLPSLCCVIVAAENAGCDGGSVADVHDTAGTQFSWITGGPACVGGGVDGVGAVGEDEQLIVVSKNKPKNKPQSVRVTKPPVRGGSRHATNIQMSCQRKR
jgi:hypothetical protein